MYKKSCFFFLFFFLLSFSSSSSNMSSTVCSHGGSLFTNEEQKKVGSWRIWHFCHTFRPLSWRHWYRFLGTKWRHVRSCSLDFRMPFFFFLQTRPEIDWKTRYCEPGIVCLFVCLFLYCFYLFVCLIACFVVVFIPIDKSHAATSPRFPFNILCSLSRCHQQRSYTTTAPTTCRKTRPVDQWSSALCSL